MIFEDVWLIHLCVLHQRFLICSALWSFSSLQSPAMYQVQMPHMTVSQSKPYRPGKGEKNNHFDSFSFSQLSSETWATFTQKVIKKNKINSNICFPMPPSPSPCSSQHAPAEVRPAPSSGHAHHDAPCHCGWAPHCSAEPCLLCPVLHLQPAAVHQPAAGPADDTLPVAGELHRLDGCSLSFAPDLRG